MGPKEITKVWLITLLIMIFSACSPKYYCLPTDEELLEGFSSYEKDLELEIYSFALHPFHYYKNHYETTALFSKRANQSST